MASLFRENGAFRLVVVIDRQRRTVRLGPISRTLAETIRAQVEHLADAHRYGQPVDGATAGWLERIDDTLHDRIARVGLVEPRRRQTLADFLADLIDGRASARPRTLINYRHTRDQLLAYFADGVCLDEVGPHDAESFRTWLHAKYAAATAGRTIKRARQFFGEAIKAGLIAVNPFAGVKAAKVSNDARKAFVDRVTVDRILAAAGDDHWRLVIALSRFGGLRCPSEHVALRWSDVKADRIWVQPHKTPGRWVPLFPELRAILESVPRIGPNVITRQYGPETNWHSGMRKLLKRAGVAPWPRLFHNLRASRQTELLADGHPVHVVCAWLGNSPAIAAEHYLTVRESDFVRATERRGGHGGSPAFTGAPAGALNQRESVISSSEAIKPIPPRGVILSTGPAAETPCPLCAGAQCSARGLKLVIRRWSALTAQVRRKILGMVRAVVLG